MLINKPNIVILMADQLTASALRAYGNNVSLTPNIDKLAREGWYLIPPIATVRCARHRVHR